MHFWDRGPKNLTVSVILVPLFFTTIWGDYWAGKVVINCPNRSQQMMVWKMIFQIPGGVFSGSSRSFSGVKKTSIFPMSVLGQIPSCPFFPKSHGRNSKTRRISVGPCNKHSGDKRTNFRGTHPGGHPGEMFWENLRWSYWDVHGT